MILLSLQENSWEDFLDSDAEESEVCRKVLFIQEP
jgi:hypothetical protein